MRWLLLLMLGGCSPAALLNAIVPAGGTTVTRGIAYRPGPRGMLDVYRPAKAGGPLVVFIYGGSWTAGDKGMYAFVGRPLAERGATVVVPDYRLYPEVRFPGFVQDTAGAVAWALSHAAGLGADPRRVFLMGHSAGAYNAALVALDPAYLAAAGASRDQLAGFIGLAGPYDFLPSRDPDVIPVFGPANTPTNDAVNHVDGRNPPLLLLHGEADTTVMPRNTRSLAQAVANAGGVVTMRFYPGIGHVGLITAFAPLFARRAPVLDDVWAFIKATPPLQRRGGEDAAVIGLQQHGRALAGRGGGQ